MYPYNILSNQQVNQYEEKSTQNIINNNIKKDDNKYIKKQNERKYVPSKPFRPTPMPSITDEKVVDMILEAIRNEKCDVIYFTKLMKMCRSEEEKNILYEIKIDDQKHERIFRRIYYKAVCKEPLVKVEVRNIGFDIRKEYNKSIFEKLKTVEFYKKLYFIIKNPEVRNMLYDIITDEQSHAIKLTYLNSLFK